MDENINIINNLIVGVILAIIIFYILKTQLLLKSKGPDSNIIRKKVFYHNDKKYQLIPIPTMCIK